APLLATAIHAGLPGVGVFVRTGDMGYYPDTTELKWTTSNGTWEPTGNVQLLDLRTPAPFRCAGPSFAPSANPTTVMGAFVAPTGPYIGESTDRAAAYWAAAQDTCFMAGGHVPRATELAELISQGLPGGTNTWLWTADEVGFEPTNGQFLNAVM